jgi:hypothetical protein
MFPRGQCYRRRPLIYSRPPAKRYSVCSDLWSRDLLLNAVRLAPRDSRVPMCAGTRLLGRGQHTEALVQLK